MNVSPLNFNAERLTRILKSDRKKKHQRGYPKGQMPLD